MLSSLRSEGQFGGLALQSRIFPIEQVHRHGFEFGAANSVPDRLGSFQSMSRQKPIMFSEKGGKILQKMATNYGKKQKQQQR